MKKNWSNPIMLNLEVKSTNDVEGVGYTISMARAAGVQCTGVIKISTGEQVQPCSAKFIGTSIEDAVRQWETHCGEVHRGHATIGEFLGHIGISA